MANDRPPPPPPDKERKTERENKEKERKKERRSIPTSIKEMNNGHVDFFGNII
jgi:hypothetical protein